MSDDPFLSRWSRLKKASAKGERVGDIPPPTVAPPVAPVAASGSAPADPAADAEREATPLPPVDSLTPESDFSPFMRAKVEESVRRQALKTLFQDPRFNVMDGLDVYIGDYSVADPLPDGWLEKMSQMAHLGDQPARVEEERRAAEQARAAAEAPAEVRNSVADAAPATPPGALSSDTSDHVDEVPPVQVSRNKDKLLR